MVPLDAGFSNSVNKFRCPVMNLLVINYYGIVLSRFSVDCTEKGIGENKSRDWGLVETQKKRETVSTVSFHIFLIVIRGFSFVSGTEEGGWGVGGRSDESPPEALVG